MPGGGELCCLWSAGSRMSGRKTARRPKRGALAGRGSGQLLIMPWSSMTWLDHPRILLVRLQPRKASTQQAHPCLFPGGQKVPSSCNHFRRTYHRPGCPNRAGQSSPSPSDVTPHRRTRLCRPPLGCSRQFHFDPVMTASSPQKRGVPRCGLACPSPATTPPRASPSSW